MIIIITEVHYLIEMHPGNYAARTVNIKKWHGTEEPQKESETEWGKEGEGINSKGSPRDDDIQSSMKAHEELLQQIKR